MNQPMPIIRARRPAHARPGDLDGRPHGDRQRGRTDGSRLRAEYENPLPPGVIDLRTRWLEDLVERFGKQGVGRFWEVDVDYPVEGIARLRCDGSTFYARRVGSRSWALYRDARLIGGRLRGGIPLRVAVDAHSLEVLVRTLACRLPDGWSFEEWRARNCAAVGMACAIGT